MLTHLHTARLLLRCPHVGDGLAVHDAVVNSLVELRAWPASLPWALAEPSVEASEAYCRESAAAFVSRSAFVFLAFTTQGRLVASTSLHSIDWSLPKFEIGYWCRTSLTGNGNTTEARVLMNERKTPQGAFRNTCVYAATRTQA